MHDLLLEFRSAIRSLLKRPGFLFTAIATLTIGIGANAAIFSFVDALLLRPLPFGDRSDRVVTLHWRHPSLAADDSSGTMSYAALQDLQDQSSIFESAGGYMGRSIVLSGVGILLGLVLSIIAARRISGVLFRVSPMDPVVFATTAGFLAAVTLLAIYLPARQAAKVDPIAALHAE
jgi:hypothetical protein